MSRVKLGKATVIALVAPPLFTSFALMLGAINSLMQWETWLQRF